MLTLVLYSSCYPCLVSKSSLYEIHSTGPHRKAICIDFITRFRTFKTCRDYEMGMETDFHRCLDLKSFFPGT